MSASLYHHIINSKLRHPNIVLIMAVCCGPTSNDILAVMEPATLGTLYNLLHHETDHKLTHYEKCCVVCDVLDGKFVLERINDIK